MDNNDSNQKVVSDTTVQPNLSIYDESNSFEEANKRKYSDAEDLVSEDKHRKKKKKSKDRDRKRSKDRDDDRKRSKKDSRDRDRSDRDRDKDRDAHRDKPSSSSRRDESRDRSSRRDGRSRDDKSSKEISKDDVKVLGDNKPVNSDLTKLSLVTSSETSSASHAANGKDVVKSSSDRDRDARDRDRDRERKPSDRSDRDREDRDRRDRDRAADREKERERDREREKDRERARERDRERDREREKERELRRKERSPERSRILVGKTRSPDTRGGDRRSYRYDGGARGRSSSADRRHRDDDKKKDETPGFKPAMLKDIIAANPGISLPEAVVRLNAYNTAVARGLDPGSMNGDIQYTGPSILPLGMAHLPSAAMHSIGINGVNSIGGVGDPITKPHRELYIGNLPPGITVPQLAEFLNSAMTKLGYSKDTNSVVTAWVSPDGHYAFVEVKSVDEANAALTYLNGIQVGAFAIRIGRPKGYDASGTGGGSSLAVPMQGGMSGLQMMNPMMMGTVGLGAANPLMVGLNNSMIGGMGLGGLAGIGTTEVMSHVIMCSNLPALISEEQIKELFSPFGELKAFNIIRTSDGTSQSAVFEYADPSIVDGVVAGMNKLDLADCKLNVQRIPASSAAVLLKPTAAPAMIPSALSSSSNNGNNRPVSTDALADYPPSAVIRLLNMTSPADLADDNAYNELLEDVSDECNTHGTVKSIIIPRTSDPASNGLIFVFFVNVADAQKCLKAVEGRRFNGKVVEGTFYPEELFAQKVYVLPQDYFVHQQQGHGGVQEKGEGGEEIGPSGPPPGVYQSTDDLDTLD